MPIELTAAAIAQIKIEGARIMEEFQSKGRVPEKLYLRMGVRGGGCSGLQYRLEFDTVSDEHDKRLEIEDITVVVDKKSYIYLNGTTLDYIPGMQGRFEFKNPKEASSCGCGLSFHPKT